MIEARRTRRSSPSPWRRTSARRSSGRRPSAALAPPARPTSATARSSRSPWRNWPARGPVPDVIARAKSGDRVAFAELYDRHVDSVYRYLLYRVREPSDAEDLASEVFTRAFANIHRYRWQGKSFLAWLYTIARNAVTDRR